ncbi:MAG: hypothetical protein ACK478_02985 [Flavobacteriales bacterium]|jgi:hypothetical protein
MKTITTLLVLALVYAGTALELKAQSDFLCMHEPGRFTADSSDAKELPAEAKEYSASFQFEQNAISYQLPKDCTLAGLLILNATGDVAAHCPIDIRESGLTGHVKLHTEQLPAGKYYIKLLADYAVVDTKQFIKVH